MLEWTCVALVAFRDTCLTLPRPLCKQHIYRHQHKLKETCPLFLKASGFLTLRKVQGITTQGLPSNSKGNLQKQLRRHWNTQKHCLINTRRVDYRLFPMVLTVHKFPPAALNIPAFLCSPPHLSGLPLCVCLGCHLSCCTHANFRKASLSIYKDAESCSSKDRYQLDETHKRIWRRIR